MITRCHDERPPTKCDELCFAALNGLSDCAVSMPQPDRDGMSHEQADRIMSTIGRDRQRADHFEHLYTQASEGKCGHSGMPLAVCKASICDCFDFPWVEPDDAAAKRYFNNQAMNP